MRILGLDLGIKSLGIAISDKTNTLATPIKVIHFEKEQYEQVIAELKNIIIENNITDIALGLPKNMDNSLGFAAERSLKFANLLKQIDVNVHLVDERLSTTEALNILKDNGKKKINQSGRVDAVAASVILESYLKEINYGR